MASLNDIETKVKYIIDLLDDRRIKTITGVLPLTFTTTEDKLRDWEISGNDDIHDGQQGVGERTENLLSFEIPYGSFSKKVHVKAGVYTLQYDTTTTSYRLDISPKINGVVDRDAIALGGDYYWVGDCYRRAANIPGGGTYSVAITVNYECDLQFRMLYAASEGITTESMLVKGSTAPSSYVPFGYEIPISVNGTPQTFYIGNAPLTAGQSISKTSTGIDIAITEGENTISTTLYNKPEMTIKYK